MLHKSLKHDKIPPPTTTGALESNPLTQKKTALAEPSKQVTSRLVASISNIRTLGELQARRLSSKRTDKIIVVGYVYSSRQNGTLLDIRGVCPTLSVGCHSGVEPKIRIIYETD